MNAGMISLTFSLLELFIRLHSSDDQVTQEKAESQALITAQILRKAINNIPICIVAQSNTRKYKELNFLDSHQIIALHFTVINDTEPENSRQIFSNTFPDIELNSLPLLGGP
uniref:Uncharacterized protein n=1 Tax=Onchocerca volvulus TaxID=6282 RepID=A0A8R1TLM3_ONCVO